MAENLLILKSLIGAKIVDISRDELHGNFTLTAKSDFGDEFKILFYELCGDVEMEILSADRTAGRDK